MEKKNPSRQVELTIISAEDLRINHRAIKKDAFVTVGTDANNSVSTDMDAEGGSYPSWNHKVELELPCNARHIRLEVKCKSITGGVRVIGGVSIPISDFLEDYVPPNHLHFLSYRLREYDGDRNGIVNISVRVKGVEFTPRRLVQAGYTQTNAWRGAAPQVGSRGYTQVNAWRGMPQVGGRGVYRSHGGGGGVAVGVPVAKGYGLVPQQSGAGMGVQTVPW